MVTVICVPRTISVTIPPKVITSLQSAGASVFQADAELKAAVKEHSAQVQASVMANPFDVGNDAMFEEWKAVARMSQAISQIEKDLRTLYSAMTDGGLVTHIETTRIASSSTAIGQPIALLQEVTATDVVAKRPSRNIAGKLPLHARGNPEPALTGNALKVFSYLSKTLDATSYQKQNIAAVARAAGVPNGSMDITLKKLVRDGFLVEGDKGHYKLPKRNL